MNRRTRQQFLQSILLGTLLTCVAAALQTAGALERPENWLYDQRCRRCQPKVAPTDRLVHVDLDDESIAAIGRWPWPRSVLASVVGELGDAGAAAIGLDVLLADRDDPGAFEPDERGTAGGDTVAPPTTGPAAPPPVGTGGGDVRDAALVLALRRANNVVLPVAFVFGRNTVSSQTEALVEILSADLEMTREQANATLANRHVAPASPDEFLTALHEAAASRIIKDGFPRVRGQQLRRSLLPRRQQFVVSTVGSRVVDEELTRAEALRAVARLGRAGEPSVPAPLHCRDEITPLPEFSAAAAGCGFVDFIVSADGVTRHVPLWVEDHGRLYPQFGLALACAYLKVKPERVQIYADRVVVPRPGGDAVLPVRSQPVPGGGSASLFMDVPFFGSADWLTSYDYPQHQRPVQHLNVTTAWEAVQTRRRIRHNNAQLDDAIANLKSSASPVDADRYAKSPPPIDDVAAREREVNKLLSDRLIRYSITEFRRAGEAERQEWDEPTRRFVAAAEAATTIPQENRRLVAQLADRVAQLRDAVAGKAVLIGSAATAVPDFRTTPLHVQCPGFVVHGMVFNAIVTNHVWRRMPAWADLAGLFLVGLLVTGTTARLPPWPALGAAVAVGGLFLAFNGYVLFARMHLIGAAAGPVAAVAGVWAGMTLARLARVSAERAHIVRRFSYYVDPALVNYVIEQPGRVRLEGEVRDLSVVVARLEGFGEITEQLRERTVELLNQYMNVVVPIIRAKGGYVNKFLGGGVMFFFGAPMGCADHAACAVEVVLAMQAATAAFNERHTRRGMPTVSLRAGISSGPMVVGDAGADSGSDYTVLGEPVNLCFRFEEANKLLGTHALLGEPTRERLGQRFLVRPVGPVVAPGMKRAVMAYEPICAADKATDRDRRLAELTADVVACYNGRRNDECLRAVGRLEAEFGASPLATAYARLCRAPTVAPGVGAGAGGTRVHIAG